MPEPGGAYYTLSVAEVAFLEARNEMPPGSTNRARAGQRTIVWLESYRLLWHRLRSKDERH